MAEETNIAPVSTETATSSPFAAAAWSEQLPAAPTQTPAATTQEPPTSTEPPASTSTDTNTNEEIVDVNEWIKREFGLDSPDILKQEREEYIKLKQTKPEELKFENDESRNVYEYVKDPAKRKELRQFLETQEKLETFIAADVNKDTAPDIIKLGMQLSNKLLTKDDIEFQYKELYSIPKEPKEPVQRASETDDEFKDRHDDWKELHDDWKERVTNIEQRKIVAAKMAIPELEKLKPQIILPEISRPQSQQQSQESLAAQQEQIGKMREIFLNTLESNFLKAEGFSTKVKDESVEFPVSFKIPDEDKVAIKGRLKDGFDVMEYVDKRWFDANGTPKIEQIITDVYEWENRDKVHQGIAQNSASKRLAEHLKSQSNIHINNQGTHQETFQPNQNGNSKVTPFSTGAWSEKPPISNN